MLCPIFWYFPSILSIQHLFLFLPQNIFVLFLIIFFFSSFPIEPLYKFICSSFICFVQFVFYRFVQTFDSYYFCWCSFYFFSWFFLVRSIVIYFSQFVVWPQNTFCIAMLSILFLWTSTLSIHCIHRDLHRLWWCDLYNLYELYQIHLSTTWGSREIVCLNSQINDNYSRTNDFNLWFN